MSWFSGAQDALEEELLRREKEKRQAMLDELNARKAESQMKDREAARRLQEAQLKQFEGLRKAQAEAAQQAMAEKLAEVLGPGATLDPETTAMLRQGNLGVLVQHQESVLPSTSMSGVAQATPNAPRISGVVRTRNAGHDERDVFRGTAKQIKAQQDLDAKIAYINSLPPDSVARKVLQAQVATGDNSISEKLFTEPEGKHSPMYVEWQDAVADGYKGTFRQYQNEDANRKRAANGGGTHSITPTAEANLILKLQGQWDKANAVNLTLDRQYRIMTAGVNRYDNDPNGASQAVLVTFQKLLDPTSVVRESEYARSAQGVSMMQRMEGYIARLSHGGAGVPKAELLEMVKTAAEFKNNTQAVNSGIRRRLELTAKKYDIPNELVFADAPDVAPPTTPGAPRKYNPATGKLE